MSLMRVVLCEEAFVACGVEGEVICESVRVSVGRQSVDLTWGCVRLFLLG